MDMMAEQIKLEREAISLSAEKFRSQNTEHNPVLSRLQQEAIIPLADAFEEYMKTGIGTRVLEKQGFEVLLKYVTPIELSTIVVKTILSNISVANKMTSLAVKVGTNMKYQAMYSHVLDSNEPEFSKVVDREFRNASVAEKRSYLRKRNETEEVDGVVGALAFKLGSVMIDLFTASTGLVTIVNIPKEGYRVEASESLDSLFEYMFERAPELYPTVFPFVVPPPKCVNGIMPHGYTDIAVEDSVPIAFKQHSKMCGTHVLNNSDFTIFDDAVNAMSSTPYTINVPILEAISYVYKVDGGGQAGLPSSSRIPMPFNDRLWSELNDDEKIIRSAYRVDAYHDNGVRIALFFTLKMAEKFAQYPEIYFHFKADTRGRLYPTTTFLTPQGSDFQKALLRLRNSKPLGVHGYKWFCIEGANNFGVDKLPLKDRVQWVKDHEHLILYAADNWKIDHWWRGADSPFLFLDFCFEYKKLKAFGGNVEDFETSLSVHMDGSCNGIQHFSAIVRDVSTGKKVNLINGERPSDIYQNVADGVNEILAEHILDPENGKYAQFWSGKITRSVVKRAVMTTPYGVTDRGIKDQLLASFHLDRGLISPTDMPEGLTYLRTVYYLGDMIKSSIDAHVSAATCVMGWLRGLPRAAKGPVFWQTPTGFMAHQGYRKVKHIRIRCYLNSSKVQLRYSMPVAEVDRRKMMNSIAPNFVHSMDASHLQLTVCKCKDVGVTDFWMIHDSYGALAGDAQVLSDKLREAFVDIYDPEGSLYKDMLQYLQDKYNYDKILPERGDLDIKEVLYSDYFFS